MSALLLNYPKKPHQLSDDLESFVHVISWLTLRYHIRCINPELLSTRLYSMYEFAKRSADGYDFGSSDKFINMLSGYPGFYLPDVRPRALRRLIKDLAKMCKEHYTSLDPEKDLQPYACDGLDPLAARKVNSGIASHTFLPDQVKSSRPSMLSLRRHPQSTPKEYPSIITKKKGEALLVNHDRILETFQEAFRLDIAKWTGDKLADQFAKLPQ